MLCTSIVLITFSVGQYRLVKQRREMQEEIDRAEQKSELLHQRYTEQIAVATGMERLKIAAEGHRGRLQTEINNLKQEYIEIENANNALENRYKEIMGKLISCEDSEKTGIIKNRELEAELKKGKLLLDETRNKYEEMLSQLTTEKTQMESNLNNIIKATEQDLTLCIRKNAKLCIIADELLERYNNKSIISSILEKEPLTQIMKVELEKFTQDYQKEIALQKEKE